VYTSCTRYSPSRLAANRIGGDLFARTAHISHRSARHRRENTTAARVISSADRFPVGKVGAASVCAFPRRALSHFPDRCPLAAGARNPFPVALPLGQSIGACDPIPGSLCPALPKEQVSGAPTAQKSTHAACPF
jgi:hypothetical protein